MHNRSSHFTDASRCLACWVKFQQTTFSNILSLFYQNNWLWVEISTDNIFRLLRFHTNCKETICMKWQCLFSRKNKSICQLLIKVNVLTGQGNLLYVLACKVNMVNVLKFRTPKLLKKWHLQTMQSQIRLLLKEQSDQGLHYLQYHLVF